MLRLSRHHRGWPQPPVAPTRPGGILMAADQLQCWRCGCQGCRGWPWQAASRLVARVRPAAPPPPDAGLGDALITAQSPLANREGCPSTRRQRSVRIRPSESTGSRPLLASRARPVQSRLGPPCGVLSSSMRSSPLQHLLDAWIQLSAALQLQLVASGAAAPAPLPARSSRSDHLQWPGIAGLRLEKGE